jgi:hypothetical protein
MTEHFSPDEVPAVSDLAVPTFSAPKETIIVVHGTQLTARRPDHRQWYEPKSVFCNELDARLEEHGSSARCWAHLDETWEARQRRRPKDPIDATKDIFTWSGANSASERSDASARLVEYLNELSQLGWRCHVIAHSHGGTVLHEALRRTQYPTGRSSKKRGYPVPWNHGNLVTMGTPLIVPVVTAEHLSKGFWHYLRQPENKEVTVNILLAAMSFKILLPPLFVTAFWVAFILLLDFSDLPLIDPLREFFDLSLLVLALGILVALVVLRILLEVRRRTKGMGRGRAGVTERAAQDSLGSNKYRILVIHSPQDEAGSLLTQVHQTKSPFMTLREQGVDGRARSGWFGRKTTAIKTFFSRALSEVRKGDANVVQLPRTCATHLLEAMLAVIIVLFSLLFFPGDSSAISFLVTSSAVIAVLVVATAILIPSASLPDALVAGYFLPWRIVQAIFTVIWLGASPHVNNFILNRAWSVIQRRALGLADSITPAQLWKVVLVDPKWSSDSRYVMQNLHSVAEAKAIKEREASGQQIMRRLTGLLSAQEMSLAKIEDVLKGIMDEDSRTVHSAYYRFSESINQIALWLANTERAIQENNLSEVRAI